MYSWIFRHLPGPRQVRIPLAVLLALAVVAILLFLVFPLVESYLPATSVTVGD
ncbi:hypothetical protein Ga0074812_101304 [Parafrankia irregularis]|uniref:Uncharacterized protein n=1 Tax=Parafrankia irregularis TaxID=795642 RepID=A0A0S4QEU8_9ACTN|nr:MULTISPECIES: hypothetical protein [Frankiaceae]EFC85863.1 hypothetical protein FrEUN1fDRAFT_1015 [Parafrankia sp. EUN1f]MBE3199529.1 hypothetical protein [Parafrankia sp. CH37]CUU53806.1 hypothetical protein Ga0074812_101304 [Parafrankia irregularis]